MDMAKSKVLTILGIIATMCILFWLLDIGDTTLAFALGIGIIIVLIIYLFLGREGTGPIP